MRTAQYVGAFSVTLGRRELTTSLCAVWYMQRMLHIFHISNGMIAVALLLVKLYKDFVVGVPVAAWLACAGSLCEDRSRWCGDTRHRQAMPLRVEYAPLLKQ